MLKKLLTGCLTIAMIGAFSASVSAETTFTWKGNAEATLTQKTTKDATDDAESISTMDIEASGDLDLVVEQKGDMWTGTAYFDLDWTASAVKVDDLYVMLSNEQLAISFGEFDPVGIGLGFHHLGEVDETYGAAGLGYDVPNEQGWLMLSLTDIGLELFVGMNEVEAKYDSDDTEDAKYGDASNDGDYGSTSFGVTYEKAFGDLELGLQYVSTSTKRNEDQSDAVAEESRYDGLSASEISLAVEYKLGEMGFTFHYTAANSKGGWDSAEELKQTWAELVFDMAFSDTMGLSASYGMRTDKRDAFTSKLSGNRTKAFGEVDTTQTDIHISFKLSTGAVDNYFQYYSMNNKEDANDDPKTESRIAYTMKVEF